MNNNIIIPNASFDFSKLSLAAPIAIQGGAYCTKLLYEDGPIYIQAPKGTTRQGFMKTGKKIYSDLMFNNTDEEFIQWIENLETKCHNLIFEKSSEWFENPLELNDIESSFSSPIKIYKSGKFYLVRSNVKMNSLTNKPLIKIYNENENPLSMEDVTSESNIISILEIQGVKFTSRNFQLEIELKQVMLLNKDIIFENCLIQKTTKHTDVLDVKSLALKNENIEENNTQGDISENKEDYEMKEIDKESLEKTLGNEPIDEINKTDNNNIENEKNEESITLLDTNNENVLNKEISIDNTEYVGDIKITTQNEENLSFENNDLEPLDIESILVDSNPEENTNHINEEDLVDSILEDIEENPNPNELTEYNVNVHLDKISSDQDVLELRKPDSVYYEMYQEVLKKAKKAKQEALNAYLEAKNIKNKYMLEEYSDSSEDSLSNISELEDEQVYS